MVILYVTRCCCLKLAEGQSSAKACTCTISDLFLYSAAADIDLVFDWIFYLDTVGRDNVPSAYKKGLLALCIWGTVIHAYLVLFYSLITAAEKCREKEKAEADAEAEDEVEDVGERENFLRRIDKDPYTPAKLYMVAAIVYEDLPQIILSVIIDTKFADTLSALAVANICTSAYDGFGRSTFTWNTVIAPYIQEALVKDEEAPSQVS